MPERLLDVNFWHLVGAAAFGAVTKFVLTFRRRGWRHNLREGVVDVCGSLGPGYGCGMIAVGLGYGADVAIGVAVLTGHYGARLIGVYIDKKLGGKHGAE